jgi:hypothetical protein
MRKIKPRRLLFICGINLTILVGLFLVAGSPFALSSIARFEPNWALLSNIGQTYGAISALLAAIGISGVAITIVLQIRESQRSRADAIRQRHYDLSRMAMDDPSLTEISEGSTQFSSFKERKLMMYVNLQLQFWLMLWEIDNLPENTLRGYLIDLFETGPGRRYWKTFGVPRMSMETGARKEERFFRVVNEEYLRLAKLPLEPPPKVTRFTRNRGMVPAIATAIISLVVGTAAGRSITLHAIRARSTKARE